MNFPESTSLPRPSHRTVRSQSGFARRAVLKILEPLRHGLLEVRLPDGQELRFGDPARRGSGAAPDAYLHIATEKFFSRCLLYGDIGFAESYLDAEWMTPDLTALLSWLLRNRDQLAGLSGSRVSATLLNLFRTINRAGHLLRRNTRANSRRNIAEHYDLSNDFFALFLDKTMTYSSAIWEGTYSLAEAQKQKYDRLCRQLRLRESDHLLEIGCGWGGMAEHAASHYGCRVTAVTVSPAQHEYATARIASKGLAHLVDVRLCDYRDLTGKYSKIVSIEMLEAVGHEYHAAFCKSCDRLLEPDGLMALQFITCPDSRYEALRSGVDFIQKHIFPGSLLLSQNRLHQLMQQHGGFIIHELRDFGSDYAETLRQWRNRFDLNLPGVRKLGFDARFARKWHYYFCYCEAAFQARNISVVQGLYTRPNNATLDEQALPLVLPLSGCIRHKATA